MRMFQQRPRAGTSPSLFLKRKPVHPAPLRPLTQATPGADRFALDLSRIPVYSQPPVAVQPKLAISTPGDPGEREADKAAEEVMRMPDGLPAHGPALYEGPSGPPAPRHAGFSSALNSACNTGGDALPPRTRQFMEPRFAQDFSAVRIHTDRVAGDLAHRIQARAFTTGNRIFFAPGEFQPDRTSGKHLLAHELAHVVQQSQGSSGVDRQVQRMGNGGLNCPLYADYDKSVGLDKYNCAGLAFRTYKPTDINATKAALSSAQSVACGTPCDHVGAVKYWLWEYDVHYEDSTSTQPGDPPRDFHIVAGPTDGDPVAEDSAEFFSKNGKRPVYGPGTAPSFRPPDKEHATKNNPTETPRYDQQGQPIYKLRSNFTESCYCRSCPKTSAGQSGVPEEKTD